MHIALYCVLNSLFLGNCGREYSRALQIEFFIPLIVVASPPVAILKVFLGVISKDP